MAQTSPRNKIIPISLSLNASLKAENIHPRNTIRKNRVVTISLLAVGIAICISIIAKVLVGLINLVTNISFHGNFDTSGSTPIGHHLGAWVILLPAAGGIIVGLMALYGSRAIRGHGIPEAMEQILTNQSKIKPAITFLKPLSAAIAIGTGGPFGAEGPIIATGGALGSTIGQLLKITDNERKILLTAGATAGMSAIFGTPVAAIFLAIELLLFEFSPRSIIPVALACITGTAGHHLLMETQPVFAISQTIEEASNSGLFIYSLLGIGIGLFSVFTTKLVYWIEDLFEKLPIHWMWWPALGGLAVGLVGYFDARTLGVGYQNISDLLSASLTFKVVLSLCLLKFTSWAIALGSGTSGGTLAPLLTIGGAAGALAGMGIVHYYPASGITIPLAALVGMSAMFAGASRAFLTSIVFALETTGQFNALLPLLAGCTSSFFVSFFLMENTIMTEKIVRRGVQTPDSFEPDILNQQLVKNVMSKDAIIINEDNTVDETRHWFETEESFQTNYFIVADESLDFKGIVSRSNLFNAQHDPKAVVGSLIKRKQTSIHADSTLREAVEKMAQENIDLLPIVSSDNTVTGILTYSDIIKTYNKNAGEHEKKRPHISLKKQGLKMLVHGQRLRGRNV